MTHPDSTVEAVANALFAVYETGVAWGDAPEEVRFLMRALARAALSAIPRPTESEVATAVYRHFTTPSREQVMRTLDASDPEGGNTNEDGIEFWGEQADAILALFEQNGAEHD